MTMPAACFLRLAHKTAKRSSLRFHLFYSIIVLFRGVWPVLTGRHTLRDLGVDERTTSLTRLVCLIFENGGNGIKKVAEHSRAQTSIATFRQPSPPLPHFVAVRDTKSVVKPKQHLFHCHFSPIFRRPLQHSSFNIQAQVLLSDSPLCAFCARHAFSATHCKDLCSVKRGFQRSCRAHDIHGTTH